MKALSFRQPWAELILQQRKTVDLRTYNSHHRGPLAIHASKTVEAEAARAHGLDPEALTTGGIVGVVELVDVIPLTEAEYEARREQHLAGRRYREGMYGWVLENPQRLAELVPARGRMSLFNVDLEGENGKPAPPAGKNEAKKAVPAYQVGEEVPPADRPFKLQVLARGEGEYALGLEQRVVEREDEEQARLALLSITTLEGDNLRAVADHVLEALRRADYRPTDLSAGRRKPFFLPEPVGVRLGLVFLAVKPLSKMDRVEAISQGIRQMAAEEAYYWYSKCTANDSAEALRAQKALRVLLAAE